MGIFFTVLEGMVIIITMEDMAADRQHGGSVAEALHLRGNNQKSERELTENCGLLQPVNTSLVTQLLQPNHSAKKDKISNSSQAVLPTVELMFKYIKLWAILFQSNTNI